MLVVNSQIIVVIIIVASGLLGGLANFYTLYNFKLDQKENRIKFYASILLSLCGSFTVPLFLQILSNNLLDNITFKNALILTGFCVLGSIFSKRFLEDAYAKVYSKLNRLDEAQRENANEIENVSNKTEKVNKKVEDLEESSEEIESDVVPTEIKKSLLEHKKGLLAEEQLEEIVKALLSNKYSFRSIQGIHKDTKIEKEKIKETLQHLVEHGFAEIRVGSNGKDYWRILKYPIKIYSATYGDVDITDKIEDLVSKEIYQGAVSPSTFGIPDPQYGTVKTLKIHYRILGKEKTLKLADGNTFKID